MNNRWIQAQRIGLMAYNLCALHATAEGFWRWRESLERELFPGGSNEASGQKRLLAGLPPSILGLLLDTVKEKKAGERIQSLRPEVEQAIEELYESKTPAPLNLVRSWVYHALHGDAPSARLIRLGHSLFKGWRHFERQEGILELLERSIRTLRDPWAKTWEREDAIEDLRPMLTKVPYGAQIENVLLQEIFAWPLLVLAVNSEESSSAAIAVSLPVDVDIEFDSKGFQNHPEIDADPQSLDIKGWKPYLARAEEVGKKLWRAKHGNHGAFREQVLGASVRFGFKTAQQIIEGLADAGVSRLELDEGSAGPYFAQVLLSRFIGQISFASAITGRIGAQIVRDGRRVLNYEFTSVGDIRAKASYVFRSRFFERLVVPAEANEELAAAIDPEARSNGDNCSSGESDSSGRLKQTADLHFANEMHTVADISQVRGWRQFQYIRCPEVAWAIHSEREDRRGLISYREPQIQRLITALRSNTNSPILNLENTSSIAVGSALWYLNPRPHARGSVRIPPSLSWAFIRCLDGEFDTRFWRVIWDVVGAPQESFGEFLRHRTRDEAGRRVANVLNRGEPDINCPSHRAPDVIVLVGTFRHEESERKAKTPQCRAFMFGPILERLRAEGTLRGPFLDEHRDLIGVTRFIVLRDDVDGDRLPVPPLEELGAERLRQLEALATFEFGFTQQMASV